jgi:LPS sulfotransferase NodH
MSSALDYLLKSENSREVMTFLRSRGARAHIVAPNHVRDLIFPDKPQVPRRNAATWSEDTAEIAQLGQEKTNFIAVAEDADRERQILDTLRQSGLKAFGLFSHVVPALLCSASGLAPGKPLADLKRYAILCVPRSGSRYLSAELSVRGVGVPREHIREPLAQIIAAGKLGFEPAIEALEKFGHRNGIFGTKLISTFVIHASHSRSSELRGNVEWMAERGYRFVHLDRPLNETVISSYIAYQMRKWHFFGKVDADARKRLDSLVFEDGAAWNEYVRFRSEKVVIDAASRWVGATTVAYSEVEANVGNIVSQVCTLIDIDPTTLRPGSVPVPVQTSKESTTYRVFAERLMELLERRAADIEPATVKKARSIAALSQKEAEDIVGEHGQ